jgi:hypothetical protein
METTTSKTESKTSTIIHNLRNSGKLFQEEFHVNLSPMDLVDVYAPKFKTYKLGKIIEKRNNGFFVMIDGYGHKPDPDNVNICLQIN